MYNDTDIITSVQIERNLLPKESIKNALISVDAKATPAIRKAESLGEREPKQNLFNLIKIYYSETS